MEHRRLGRAAREQLLERGIDLLIIADAHSLEHPVALR